MGRADEAVMQQFEATFQLPQLVVHEAGGWRLSVRPGQITLGSMVLSAADGALDFASIHVEASKNLTASIAVAERVAKGLFGAVRINLACLMMKDPVVHFHVLPRYDAEIERYGQRWQDRDWPGPPTFGKVDTSTSVVDAMTEDIRGFLSA